MSKVAVTEVASLMVAEELTTPRIMTTASWPLVGKSVPTKSIWVELVRVTEEMVGEPALSYSYWQSAAEMVLPQEYCPTAVLIWS